MKGQHSISSTNTLAIIILAGLAGGLAEIIWIGAISSSMTFSATAVAREITASIFPSLRDSAYSPLIGIGIHLVLSIILATAYIFVIKHLAIYRFGLTVNLIAGVLTLVAVWLINFLVILPLLNPLFIALVSYGPSLISKIFFAVAMVLMINYHKEIINAREIKAAEKLRPQLITQLNVHELPGENR